MPPFYPNPDLAARPFALPTLFLRQSFQMRLLLLCLLAAPAFAQPYHANWASLDQRATPAWFDEAKFGIFIHWGLYSVPAWAETKHDPDRKDWKYTIHYAEWYWRLQRGEPGEWKGVDPYPDYHRKTYGDKVQYPDFVKDFSAQYFEPEDWAEVFRNAGAKYVVLTSKHHDGYALWPSEHAFNWNSVDLNPHRDLVGDLTNAVRAAGLRMGLYYSLYEWYNPLYLKHPRAYVEGRMLPQLKDIVTATSPNYCTWTANGTTPANCGAARNFWPGSTTSRP
jgi:alpha-L-fucosidase